MVVRMNTKALHMVSDNEKPVTIHPCIFVQVCKEKQVKKIKPNHDVPIINKRNTEATILDQDLTAIILDNHIEQEQ